MAAPAGNKYALGADSGRPPAFETPEELALKASEYFRETSISEWTITGLTLHLGFCDRQSLYDYQKKDEFTGIIKKCRLMVEMAYEQKLNGKEVTGAIFALKNMGWKDKSETEMNVSGGLQVIFEAAPNCDPIKDNDNTEQG